MIQIQKALPATNYGTPTVTNVAGTIWGFVVLTPTSIDSTWSHDNGAKQPLLAGTLYNAGREPWGNLQIQNASPGTAANIASAGKAGGGGGSTGNMVVAIARAQEDVADLPVPPINFTFRPQTPIASIFGNNTLGINPNQTATIASFGLDPGFARVLIVINVSNTDGANAQTVDFTLTDGSDSEYDFQDTVPAGTDMAYEIWFGEGTSAPGVFTPVGSVFQLTSPAVLAIPRNVNTSNNVLSLQANVLIGGASEMLFDVQIVQW